MLRLLVILFLFPFYQLMGQNIVTITIDSLPENHPEGSDLYIAGSFNAWNPQADGYKFSFKDGKYSYQLKVLSHTKYEYKITRGGWDKVECNKDGSSIANRQFWVEGNTELSVKVAEWQDRFPAKPRRSTANSNVHIIDTAFWIPQLKRTRKIWICLPQTFGYDLTTTRYPVLYMQDGQNMFDDSTSFAGEWNVDEYFESIGKHPCIIVAIDHGGDKRMNEYNPYDNERFGKGEGDAYIDFIVKTLKPYIDKHYRTLKGKRKTYIAGSSMGGLISMYAVLKYPKVFKGAAVFSPSFWITGSKIYDDIRKKGKKVKSNIFFYAGKQESERMVPDMLKAFETMSSVSKSKMTVSIKDGGHNEATWRKEIGAAIWLIIHPQPYPFRQLEPSH